MQSGSIRLHVAHNDVPYFKNFCVTHTPKDIKETMHTKKKKQKQVF